VDERSVLGRRHDEDPLAGHELRYTVHRVLQEAPTAEEIEELLWALAT
jgi:hypothetical protein